MKSSRVFTKEDAVESYVRRLEASRKRVAECGVFDIKGREFGLRLEVPKPWHPCPFLVSVYARLGLHRYSLSNKGKKFQFSRVRKYVKTTPLCAASYYITVDAIDPISLSKITLQTQVSERNVSKWILSCNIARIRGETQTYNAPMDILKLNKLKWPLENPFEKHYMVKEVEDWIRLYLDLAVFTKYTSLSWTTSFYDPSKLEILKVAMAVEDVNEGPDDAHSVIVLYIRYKDLCEDRVGKDVDRVAMVRRRFNEVTGWFSLEAQIHSSDIVMPKKREAKNKSPSPRSLLFRQRLGIHKPWRLYYPNPRVCKAYRNNRLVHKKREAKNPRSLLFRQRLGIHKPWRLCYPNPRVCKAYRNRCMHKKRSIS